MGTYATVQFFTKEMKADDGIDMDAVAADGCLRHVLARGLTPAGDPVLKWDQLGEVDVMMAALAGEPPFRVGDWRVLALIEVAEEAPAVRWVSQVTP